MAALRIETPDGEFEVVGVCIAGMAPHVQMDGMVAKSQDDMDVDGEVIYRTLTNRLLILDIATTAGPSVPDHPAPSGS